MPINQNLNSIKYQAMTSLLDLVLVANRTRDRVVRKNNYAKAAKIRYYLNALSYYPNYIGADEANQILQCLIVVSGIQDYPVAPSHTALSNPVSAIGLKGDTGPPGPVGPAGGATDFLAASVSTQTVVDTFSITSGNAARWDYIITGPAQRAGTIYCTWSPDGLTISQPAEQSTDDIGGTTIGVVTFSVSILSGNVRLIVTPTSGTWTVRGSRYLIPNYGIGSGPVIETPLPSAHIFVGNSLNQPQARQMTGDISIDNTGLTAIQPGVINNSDINSSADIALSKLASVPNNNTVLISTGVGKITSLPLGSNGQVLTISGGSLIWGAGGGGGGITNSAAANELMVSDGTNAIGRKIFSTSNGDIRLGDTGLAGNERKISVEGSSGTVNLDIVPKGSGVTSISYPTSGSFLRLGLAGDAGAQRLIAAQGSTTDISIGLVAKGAGDAGLIGGATISLITQNSSLIIEGNAGLTTFRETASVSGNGQSLIIRPGDGNLFSASNGGNLLFSYGQKGTSGLDGNIAFNVVSSPNFQSMQRGIFIANSEANPTGNPTSGGFLYVDASDASKLKWRVPSGTTYDLTATGGGGGGITDGDKGDVTVSGGGTVWTVDTIQETANVTTGTHTSAPNQALLIKARKASAGTITKGQIVYITGSSGTHLLVELARADSEATSAYTIGVAATTITNTSDGFVMQSGRLTGLSTLPTATFSDGDTIYLSETTDGGYRKTLPTAPNHGVFIGFVIRASNGGVGELDVHIQNYQELDELSDVSIAGIAANDFLVRNAGNTRWENRTTASVKSVLALNNVDNTSDANKPISNATQTALNGKENSITAGTTSQYFRGDKTFQTLDKAAVGLSNVDNTSDVNKPISTATQTALDGKQKVITSGTAAPSGGVDGDIYLQYI